MQQKYFSFYELDRNWCL